MTNEYSEMFVNRENMYRLLARLCRREVDDAFLAELQQLKFPVAVEEKRLASGYVKLAAFLKDPGDEAVTALAADYDRIFHGVGAAKGAFSLPCESVYTSKGRLVQQAAWRAVRKLYVERGVIPQVTEDLYEDHLARELEFMAHLCLLARKSAEANDMVQLTALFCEQRDFLEHHLLNWVNWFANDVRVTATTAFYPAVTDIMVGFLALEEELFKEILQSY